MCDYDVTQCIGRRYRRQDEVGTPWCVTVDFDSLEDHAVTVRDRDTTEQVRIPIPELSGRAAPAHRPGVKVRGTEAFAQATLRYLRTAMGTSTSSRPIVHNKDAHTAPELCSTPPTIRDRAPSTTCVTGWCLANACSQPGMVRTGTKADEAKSSGKIRGTP